MTTKLNRTGVFEFPGESSSRRMSFWNEIAGMFLHVWSATRFDDQRVTEYAENLMLEETRLGIKSMALLSLAIQVTSVFLYQKLGAHGSFLYSYGLLAVLSIHVLVSVRFVSDIRALNLLGTILLVITGIAIMAIAHRTGSINAGLLSSIVLLFMVMPIVPWGLREALTVVLLTYITFTFSFLSVEGRFDTETLWTVQFLILASATTAILTIVRNTVVRKDDIRVRYELENAHRELQLISTRDPLTGAWNRRFMEQQFDRLASDCHENNQQLRLALLDIDRFKHFNDTYGHHCGDTILKHLAQIFVDSLPSNAHFIRLGGDEFAVLFSGEGLEQIVERCLNHLFTDPKLLEQCDGEPVTVSVGVASGPTNRPADLTGLYKAADESLYQDKGTSGQSAPKIQRLVDDLARTGSMRIKK